jgi:hypothetical protein
MMAPVGQKEWSESMFRQQTKPFYRVAVQFAILLIADVRWKHDFTTKK